MVNNDAAPRTGGGRGWLRIATEEAFITPSVLQGYLRLLADPGFDDPGFRSLWGFYGKSQSARAQFIHDRLQDLGAARLADMDAAGIDHAVLALTAPGVQVFDPATATALAKESNDLLHEACRAHPTRYTGMAAIAPQAVDGAVREMRRAVQRLGMKAVILNGHTLGQYHDAPAFWPIYEAAEALDVPIYLHPTGPSRQLIQPFLEAGLDGAVFGFGVDTGLHMLRIICAGVFDRFPKLQFIIGHAGEALPYWQYRLDYMHAAGQRAGRYPQMAKLAHPVSHYLKHNVLYTNSGVAWAPAVQFMQQTVGVERVMYAMDYPYQYEVDEVRAMDAMPLPPADHKAFYQTNAERVFKLRF